MTQRICALLFAILALVLPGLARAEEETTIAQVKGGQNILSSKKHQGFLETNGLGNDDFWTVWNLTKENHDRIGIYCSHIVSFDPVEDPQDGDPKKRRVIKGNFRCLDPTPAAAPGTLIALPKGRETLRREVALLGEKLKSERTHSAAARGAWGEATMRADQIGAALTECNSARAAEDRQVLLKSRMIPTPLGVSGLAVFLLSLGFGGLEYRKERRRREQAENSLAQRMLKENGQKKLADDLLERLAEQFGKLNLRKQELDAREKELANRSGKIADREAVVKMAEGDLQSRQEALAASTRNLESERASFEQRKLREMSEARDDGYTDGISAGRAEAAADMKTAVDEARAEAGRITREADQARERIIAAAEAVKQAAVKDAGFVREEAEADRQRAADLLKQIIERESALAAQEGELAGREYGLNEREGKLNVRAQELLDETVALSDARTAMEVSAQLAKEAAERELAEAKLGAHQEVDEERIRLNQEIERQRRELERLKDELVRTEEAARSAVLAALSAPPSSGPSPFAASPSTREPPVRREPVPDAVVVRTGARPEEVDADSAPPVRHPTRPYEPGPEVTAANERVTIPEIQPPPADLQPATGAVPPDSEPPDRITAPGIGEDDPDVMVTGETAEEFSEDYLSVEPLFDPIMDSDDAQCQHCREVVKRTAMLSHLHVQCLVCPDSPILKKESYQKHAERRHQSRRAARRARRRKKNTSAA